MTTESTTTTEEMPVLLTGKLRPPLLHRVLVRKRLLKLAEGEEQNRIAIICAGPGYGKTTLMAHLAKAHPGTAVWYQVDGLDTDPAIFLRNVIQGVVQAASDAIPDLGQRATARLEGASNIEAEGESILGVLADEISEKVREPLLLCLDDYHLLAESATANRLIGFLARQGPEQLRLVLTSRMKPRLALGRLRSQGKVAEIGEGELRFTFAELKELLGSTWEMDLPTAAVRQLHENTEGWAASFVLAENLLKQGDTVPELFAGSVIRKNIYEYLAEEVLSRQPKKLRDFLTRSSLIDPVDPEVCRQALARDDSGKMLEAAEDNNLFTSRIEGTGLFRYHPLFREFLQEQLRETGEAAVLQLHVEYAGVFESIGKPESAIEHYFAGGVLQKATGLLAEIGSDLIASGKYATLEKWLELIPEGEGPAAIDVYRGEVLLLKGDVAEARKVLEAARLRIDAGQIDILVRCSIALAESMNMLFEGRDAAMTLKPLLEMDLSSEQRIEVLIKLGVSLGQCSRRDEAEFFLTQAEELARKEVLPQAVRRVAELSSLLSTVNGDFVKTLRLQLEAINISDSLFASKRSNMFDSLAFTYVLIGEYEKAEEMWRECLERVKAQKEKRLMPYIYDLQGWILITKSEFAEGEKYLIKSINLFEEIDVSWACGSVCHLGTAYRRWGRFAKGFEQHNRCIELAERVNHDYARAIGVVNIGADLIHLEQFDEARDLLDEAVQIATENSFAYVLTQAEYHKAWLGYLTEDFKAASDLLVDALGRASVMKHNHFIIQESRLTLPLLSFALTKDIESDYVFWILEKRGDAALPALEPLVNHESPVQRQKVAQAIGKVESSSSLSLLRKMTRDGDARVRSAAQSAIEQLRPRFKTTRELLTVREEEVLRLIADGLSNGSIAQSLFISERTVKTHVSRIFQKLGMTNRLEAALYYKGLKNTTS